MRVVVCGTLIEWPANDPSVMDTSELLRERRIDRDGRPPRARRLRLLLAAAALVVLGVAGWLVWSRIGTPTVRTVTARAATPAGGPGSVLDARGHVTARPQGTVSANINREGTRGPIGGATALTQG